MSTDSDYDCLYRLLLIGPAGVGKSSLLLKFADNVFSDTYVATIGVDFRVKTVELDGKRFKLQMWDTAGAERFRSITTSYYRGANGVIIVYDITDQESFNNVNAFLRETEKFGNESAVKLLIGNKCDLEEKRAVTLAVAKEYADSVGIPLIETSAKTGSDIENAFMTMVKTLSTKNGTENGETKQKMKSRHCLLL